MIYLFDYIALLSCDQSITNNDQTICSKWINEEEIIQLLSQNSNLINRSVKENFLLL